MREIRTLASKTIGTALLLALASCGGESKTNSDGIEILVQPASNAYLTIGPYSSCSDKATFLASGGTISRSVTGPAMMFNTFGLKWTRSTETLYVSLLRVTLTGGGLKESPTVIDIGADEFGILVDGTAVGTGIVKGSTTGAVYVNSADTTRSVPCGLAVGPVELANGTSTTSFSGKVKVELRGFSVNTDGTVTGSVRAEAESTYMWDN